MQSLTLEACLQIHMLRLSSLNVFVSCIDLCDIISSLKDSCGPDPDEGGGEAILRTLFSRVASNATEFN